MDITYLIYPAVGLVAGICSGLFGIGGGIIIVPLLVYLAHTGQHKAVGTSLIALLLPVGALAVYEYYKAGKIMQQDIVFGLLVAVGLFAGAWLGSRIGLNLSETVLRKSFAVFLVLVGVRFFFKA